MGFSTFNMGTLEVSSSSTHLIKDEANKTTYTATLTTGGTPEELIPADATATHGRELTLINNDSETVYIGFSDMTGIADAYLPIPPNSAIQGDIGQGSYYFVAATTGTSVVAHVIPYIEV